MRRFFNWFVLLPLAIILILFAVANRTEVVVSFDPFEGKESPLTVFVPLFIVIFASVIIGVIIGALASLARQWRLWRAARNAEEEAKHFRAELEARARAEPPPPKPDYPSLPMAG
jgi:uncharacterized integral membrane protein